MKKKIKLGPLKLKLSYKSNKWFKFFKKDKELNKKEFIFKTPDPAKLLEYKLYRIFKQDFCQFFPGENYSTNNTQPTSLVYYINKNKEEKELIGNTIFNNETIEIYKVKKNLFSKEKYLIGELLFGEDKTDFFKRKNISIKETIENYTLVQNDFVLATYDKDWINKQGVYQ